MKPEKKEILETLEKKIKASPYVMLADYAGLTVSQFTELRKKLREARAECHVVKNTMAERAISGAGLAKDGIGLTGMTAMVTGTDDADVCAAAKTIKEFARQTQKPKFKMGFMADQALSAEQLLSIADLPPLNALRGQLVGMLQTPATRLAVLMSAPAGQLARVLKAYADQPGGANGQAAAA